MAISVTSASDLATSFGVAVSISVTHSTVWCYRFSTRFVLATWQLVEDFKQPSGFAHSRVSRQPRTTETLPAREMFALTDGRDDGSGCGRAATLTRYRIYLPGGTVAVPGAVSALDALSSQAVYQRFKSI